MNNKPKVSIICPSYNHEKYVKFFIESVLNQTDQDFELVIIDDCSTDNNVKEIKKFNDSRIRLIQHEWNKGFVVTWEELIREANGDILCCCASDDVLMPNYVEDVVKAFNEDKNLDVFYTFLQYIDEENNILNGKITRLNTFLSKYELLKESFIGQNQLTSPGMACKKEKLVDILPFSCGLLQYIDWQIHTKLLLNDCNIKISEQCLVKYRISPNSASARSKNVLKREACETYSIMEPFLSIKNIDFFKKIFKGLYEEFGNPTEETIPYFIARMAMKSKLENKQRWGYETLLKFVCDYKMYEKIHKLYNVDFKTIINTVNSCTYINNEFEKKYIKYKKLYNIFLILFIIITILWLCFL